MAKFELNKTLFSGVDTEWNYEEVGTLKKICKGFTLRFGSKNLKKVTNDKGDYNRVVIFGKKGEDTYNIPCSKPLSEAIRLALTKKLAKEVLASLVGLQINAEKDNPEKYFLMAPEGMTEGFLIDELVDEEVTYEELVAF